jgi:cell wall-associated NlpC family hydrolase
VVASAGATQFTTTAANEKVNQTQTQIAQIEQTLAQEQHQSAVLGQQYDAEMVHLQAIRAEIAATDARIAQIRHTIAVDKHVLAKAAVQDYVLGAQGTQITSLFSTSANTMVISEEYSNTAVGNLNAARHALQAAQVKLTATRVQQQAQQAQAQASAAKLQVLQQENEQAAKNSQNTLNSLKGSLGVEVRAAEQAKAQREAAAAAAAAAAQRAAQAAAAAAAAAQAAQLATQLGGTAQAAAQAANAASAAAGGPSVGFSGTVTAAGEAAVRAAESQLGVPYVWGGESPGVGFDCSGLTQWSWGQAGVGIPRTSEQQYATLPRTSLSSLEAGDLLFYYNLDGTGTVDHVVMYVGSGPYGSQTVIQAPFTGSTVSYAALYTYGLVGAGRP